MWTIVLYIAITSLTLFTSTFFLILLVSVLRAGPHQHKEAKNLQGGLDSVMSGKAKPLHDVESDPRFVEGMTRNKETGEVYLNNRLSDDYIKNLLGA